MADAPTGLRFDGSDNSDDDALSELRRQAESLNQGLQFDVDRGGAFGRGTDAPTDLTAGLAAAADPETLARRLGERAGREPDLRLRRLVERADQAIGRGDLTTASELADEALGLDRTNVTAWLLKARCLVALAGFDEARRVIAVARRYARDDDGIRLADAAAATCHQEEMRELGARLARLVAENNHVSALAEVRPRLADHPDDPTLLQYHCILLLRTGDLASARTVAEGALRRVDRSHANTFEDLLRLIAQRECEPRIDQARAALRRGDTATAVHRLDECLAALGDDPEFAALRSYARKRHTEAGASTTVRRLRRRRDGSGPLTDDQLQEVIQWLVQEELDAGLAAAKAGRFGEARRQFAAAGAIDDRCALIALLHGHAIFGELLACLGKGEQPPLDSVRDRLLAARNQVERCIDDPTVGAQGRQLLRSIEAAQAVVDVARARAARIKAVNDCMATFNALVNRYSGIPMTREERQGVRWRFQALTRDVRDLRRTVAAEPLDPGLDANVDAALGQLSSALASAITQLR